MNQILYLDENQKETSCDVFLTPYEGEGIDVKRLKKLMRFFDFTGAPIVSSDSFNDLIQRFPSDARRYLEDSVLVTEEGICLRGRNYYLDIQLGNPRKVIEAVTRDIPILEDLISTLGASDLMLEDNILALTLLDYKRHFSLIALAALYEHMLNHSDFPVEAYERHLKVAEQDITNYYALLLGVRKPEVLALSQNSLSVLRDLEYPKQTERDSGASKLVFREMDHPGQLLLFAGNLLRWDGEQKIGVVVNPLFGAIEVGYALRAITEAIGVRKIDNVYFIKYSLHREGHAEIENGETQGHFPDQLKEELRNIGGRRVVIIDDMYNIGTTLRILRELFRRYSANLAVATVEMNYTYHRQKGDLERCLNPSELLVPPISDWRYVRNIERKIKNRLV